ncbi:hypothetical protein Z967_11970 [Clostridium novyi A str. 4540]|uniref:GIY-YIG nuclease family protein n=1 Tax=Clostridium novyi TaxID=1542 RepID=UPI0004DA2768|nr:GIY-YIG nuclease family protein [Clostridium novyi]KEH88975.1 hypothetical protein Z967_11970 [Clostridium novyi A str. 4540]
MLEKQGKINVCGVYGIKNTQGKILYIGSSKECNDAYSRHKANLINGNYFETNKHKLQELFNTQDLLFYVIKECKEDELVKEETKYIKLHNKTIVNADRKGKRRKSKPTKEETLKRRKANLGEKNPHNTKLSEDQVREIKMLLRKGIRQTSLADEYDVSPTLIWNIKHGNRWASVSI